MEVFDDIDDMVFTWESMYKDILSEFIQTRNAKVKSHSLPWINREIKKLMNRRYKALQLWQKSRHNNDLREEYKRLKNLVNRELKAAEADYWNEKFTKSSSSKEFWNTVKQLKRQNINKEGVTALLNQDGKVITSDPEKADLLNDFFVEVGEKLAEKFEDISNDGENSLITRVTPISADIYTNQPLLSHQISVLKVNKAAGHDNILPKDLKTAGESILPGMKMIIDKSFKDCKFPNYWKIAKVKSAYKKGPKVERKNYRPLSLLSIPSKVHEGQICYHLDNHMNANGAKTPNQWGFSEGKSTELLLLHMTEIWKYALDQGKVVGVLLIDFKKAFDSINHNIMMKKLRGCGVSGPLLRLLENYLQGRSQYVQLSESNSKTRTISYGVPQSSQFGPRLFSLYVNDLPSTIKSSEVSLFADDSTFYSIGSNIEEVIDALNETGKQIFTWCCENKLTIHTGKSEVMLLTNRNVIGPLIPVSINDQENKYMKTASCLGIVIDNHLRWDAQAQRVSKSFAAKVCQLKRMRFLPVKVQEEIYFKTIIAAVTYAITVWGTCSPALFEKFRKDSR